jgi:adenylosuccinate synthase
MAQAYIVAGMAFGDESKGATVDALCRSLPIDLIVRYNGGCQAAHHVVLEDGRSHCFSQFGAGMLANNKVRTHLSRYMLVEPFSMMKEADALGKMTDNVWERTTVDRNAVIVTPIHRAINRIREQRRGVNAHGSCGRGIGVAREMQLKHGGSVLMAKDLEYHNRTMEKLEYLLDEVSQELQGGTVYFSLGDLTECADRYQNWPATLVSYMPPMEWMVFEGAQGVMLDEKHGTAPHNTWTNTTFENADTLLEEVGIKRVFSTRIGCFRSYFTRHGAGPFRTEETGLDLPEPHNNSTGFQGKFRVGRFDYEMAEQALNIVKGVDFLSVSHLDYLPKFGVSEQDFLEHIEDELGTPVRICSHGPTAAHRKIDLGVTA